MAILKGPAVTSRHPSRVPEFTLSSLVAPNATNGHDRSGRSADLQKTLAEGDETLVAFRKMADDYITEAAIDAPDDKSQPDTGSASTIPSGSMRELDLRQAGISSVVWATGSRYDFRWIHFPIFDAEGEPAHQRGVTSIPGLYFPGLQWLYKRKSAFFWGIGEDAAYLAEHIAARM
jgi:putative flavoprotein involved in K+ transport